MLSLQNAKVSRNRVLAVRCAVIILLCGALLMISTISTTNVRAAQGQSAAGKFRRIGKPIPNQYIVVLNDDILSSEVASRAAEMARASGGSVGHIYRYALRGFSARMSEVAAIGLSLDPRVEFVEEDGVATVATTQTNPPWGLDRIDQSGSLTDFPLDHSYTYNETGAGVNAYVIDTGVRTTHQDFGGRAFLGADCTVRDGNGNCIGGGTDGFGHGTSVASLVGGNTYGVAKSVTIYNVRVCGSNGNCVYADWIAGIDWVTNDHTNNPNHTGPAVANQSLGTTQDSGPSTAIDKAVRRSIAGGVTHVVAAKNSNVNLDLLPVSPARVTQAITVGATGNDAQGADPVSDQRASFSNFGSVLDLFAPGVKTPAASPFSDTAADPEFGGTSASSPHVAGAVARYLQTDPTACP
jgi:subtilisin family serine protease